MSYTNGLDNPELYFQTKLYTGNGSDGNAITLDGSENMQPDLVWIKERSTTNSSRLYDSSRGVNSALISNSNNTENQYAEYGQFESFDSDGFTVGAGTTNGAGTNANSATIVAWCWKESATAGFDIVTATGNATAKTISHSLSAVPHWIISKEKTGSVNDWTVYHHKNTSAPETDSLILNETNATSDQNTHWNDTAPTSSVFTVGTGSVVNRNSSTYVYYLWSEKKGYSKFGSYTGGNSPFVYTGFKPAFILVKGTSVTSNWTLLDNKRNTFNVVNAQLQADLTNAESSSDSVDFTAQGFKVRNQYDSLGSSGNTYIFMAFAESPFVNSKGVPNNAR